LRWLMTILSSAVLLGSSCGAPRCNPPNSLPTHLPGTCTEAGTACSEHGYCEPCGHSEEICCTGNTCGVDPLGTALSCQPPAVIGGLDGVCR
jgi:hypothetical protein